jgi:hypothetical protein
MQQTYFLDELTSTSDLVRLIQADFPRTPIEVEQRIVSYQPVRELLRDHSAANLIRLGRRGGIKAPQISSDNPARFPFGRDPRDPGVQSMRRMLLGSYANGPVQETIITIPQITVTALQEITYEQFRISGYRDLTDFMERVRSRSGMVVTYETLATLYHVMDLEEPPSPPTPPPKPMDPELRRLLDERRRM